MAAGSTQIDVLSRVRREQRMRAKVSDYSGLRIVFIAAAITVGIVIFAFGAIGMLMMARSPQDSIVSKLDPLPEFTRQPDTNPAQAVAAAEPPVVIPAPEVVPPISQSELQRQIAVQMPNLNAEAETTASIPAQAEQTHRQVPQAPQPHVRPQTQTQTPQAARRPVPEAQADNPLFQLFGIRKYR